MAGSHSEPSRRAVLGYGAAGAAAALLAGCAASGRPSHSGPLADIGEWAPGPGDTAGARRGGRVITAWSSEAQSYDPAIGWDLHSWEAAATVLHAPLYQFSGQTGEPAPHAAATMPRISRDRREYTIRLRPGVRFHHGRTVTADDYIRTWTRLLDPELASWASGYLLTIDGAREVYEQKARSVRGLKAADSHTLVVRLAAPDITFLNLLCQPYTAALPHEEIRRLGAAFGRTPVGTGPFRIQKYDTVGRRALFRRFDDYFWSGTPLIDELEYRWGIEPSMQMLQLAAGRVDVLGEGLVPSQAAKFTADPVMRRRFVQRVPVRGSQWIAVNAGRPELADRRVRQALSWAVDRVQLQRVAFGAADPWGCAFPRDLDRYRRTATPYTHDPQRARELLRQAGIRRLKLRFLHGTADPWPLIGQVLQQQLDTVGVKIELEAMSDAAFGLATSEGKGDLYGTNWYLVQGSALELVNSCFTSTASVNYTGYANDRVDALAAIAQQAPTVEQSNAVLAQIEDLLTRDAAGIFIGSLNFLAARSPSLRNYRMRGETGSYYDRMWIAS